MGSKPYKAAPETMGTMQCQMAQFLFDGSLTRAYMLPKRCLSCFSFETWCLFTFLCSELIFFLPPSYFFFLSNCELYWRRVFVQCSLWMCVIHFHSMSTPMHLNSDSRRELCQHPKGPLSVTPHALPLKVRSFWLMGLIYTEAGRTHSFVSR